MVRESLVNKIRSSQDVDYNSNSNNLNSSTIYSNSSSNLTKSNNMKYWLGGSALLAAGLGLAYTLNFGADEKKIAYENNVSNPSGQVVESNNSRKKIDLKKPIVVDNTNKTEIPNEEFNKVLVQLREKSVNGDKIRVGVNQKPIKITSEKESSPIKVVQKPQVTKNKVFKSTVVEEKKVVSTQRNKLLPYLNYDGKKFTSGYKKVSYYKDSLGDEKCLLTDLSTKNLKGNRNKFKSLDSKLSVVISNLNNSDVFDDLNLYKKIKSNFPTCYSLSKDKFDTLLTEENLKNNLNKKNLLKGKLEGSEKTQKLVSASFNGGKVNYLSKPDKNGVCSVSGISKSLNEMLSAGAVMMSTNSYLDIPQIHREKISEKKYNVFMKNSENFYNYLSDFKKSEVESGRKEKCFGGSNLDNYSKIKTSLINKRQETALLRNSEHEF